MKKFFAIWMIAGLCSLGAYFFVTASSKPPALDISAAGKKNSGYPRFLLLENIFLGKMCRLGLCAAMENRRRTRTG
ncbi:hypothetical protein BSK33_11120 [Geobacillus sp. 44B]|nr:hypothetical protein BSK33_11120 [Geobacillus sp. 44B]